MYWITTHPETPSGGCRRAPPIGPRSLLPTAPALQPLPAPARPSPAASARITDCQPGQEATHPHPPVGYPATPVGAVKGWHDESRLQTSVLPIGEIQVLQSGRISYR